MQRYERGQKSWFVSTGSSLSIFSLLISSSTSSSSTSHDASTPRSNVQSKLPVYSDSEPESVESQEFKVTFLVTVTAAMGSCDAEEVGADPGSYSNVPQDYEGKDDTLDTCDECSN